MPLILIDILIPLVAASKAALAPWAACTTAAAAEVAVWAPVTGEAAAIVAAMAVWAALTLWLAANECWLTMSKPIPSA